MEGDYMAIAFEAPEYIFRLFRLFVLSGQLTTPHSSEKTITRAIKQNRRKIMLSSNVWLTGAPRFCHGRYNGI